jgi:hypothetical protein
VGANHPYEPRFPWPDEDYHGISALEVWQWQYGLDERPGTPLPPDARRPRHAPVEFLYRNSRAMDQWHRLLATGKRVTPVAVCDFHVGGPAQQVTSPCTLVWSKGRGVDELLAGIKAGRVTLVEEPKGARVELWGDRDGDGRFEALPGDEVPADARLQVRVTGGQGQWLSVRDINGVVVGHDVPTDPYVEELVASRPGYYVARLDRHRALNPILSMTGALFVTPLDRSPGP